VFRHMDTTGMWAQLRAGCAVGSVEWRQLGKKEDNHWVKFVSQGIAFVSRAGAEQPWLHQATVDHCGQMQSLVQCSGRNHLAVAQNIVL